MRRILFVLATDYLPASISGANVSQHALCKRLAAAGFEPLVVCAPDRTGAALPAGGACQAPTYPVLRVVEPLETMKEIIARLGPEAIVVRAPTPGARAAEWGAATGRRLHIYFESDFLNHGFPVPSAAPTLRYAANSPFLARLAQAYFGAPVAMVPPLIDPDEYRCETTGDAVLFVNPVAIKGVHIAAAIAARLPHRRFLFLHSWPDQAKYRHIEVRLPNVEWVENTDGMRRLFERAKLVLMPSVWEESSGRTLGEAQVSGIPCVASDRGGLAESVGPGGVVLSLGEPIERWCDAIETLYTDPEEYARVSRLAKLHAARSDFLPEAVVATFLDFIAS